MHALFGVVLVTEGGDSSVPPHGLVGYPGRGRRARHTTKGVCPGTWEALGPTAQAGPRSKRKRARRGSRESE